MSSRNAKNATAPLDPELIQKIVDELKSQGTFDQFRKDCMAEVDTKPAYQNLRQRVSTSLNKFLDRQQWKPTQNKNQLRNQLRKHIEDSGIMENGVRRIVDQVVNPKILSVIEPEVECVMYNILGVEKPCGNADEEAETLNGREEKTEKASSESLDDVEMRSVHDCSDEEDFKKNESPSSSPDLAGQISPLTPERKKGSDSPVLEGNVSPLTPPPRSMREDYAPGSPHTPPLPPLPPPPPSTMFLPPPPQLSDFREDPPPPPPLPPPPADSMSPVSDTELADLSPPEDSPETPSSESGLLSPPPPLPPPPSSKRPPSPLTSPIGSSPDLETPPLPPPLPPPPAEEPPLPPASGPSDISDTDLPCQSSDDKSSDVDIEDLEKAREAILAKMAATSLNKEDSDEGEIHTEDDEEEDRKVKKPEDDTVSIISAQDQPSGNLMPEHDMSPISDDSSSHTDKEKKDTEDDHEELKKRQIGEYKTSSDDDDIKPPISSEKGADSSSITTSKLQTKESSTEESSRKSSKHDHRHHHHSKSSKNSNEKRRRHSSSSSSSSSSFSKDKYKDKIGKDKSLKKMEKIEQKVNKAITLKSDKFKDIDMFAPKAPKPKPPLHRPPSSCSTTSSSSCGSPLPSFGAKSPLSSFGAKSPLAWGNKTPPTFGAQTPVKSPTAPIVTLRTPATPESCPPKISVSAAKSTPSSPVPSLKKSSIPSKSLSGDKFSKEFPSGHEKLSAAIVERSKIYPELPISKSGGDKIKQHEDDFAESKRRLELARAKKLKAQKKEELIKKEKKKLEKRLHDKYHYKVKRKLDEDNDEIEEKISGNRQKTKSEEVKRCSQTDSPRLSQDNEKDLSFMGFQEKELKIMKIKSVAIKEAIEGIEQEIIFEEEKEDREIITISGLANPYQMATSLKSKFGGNPKIFHPPPSWLALKLNDWDISREEVGIMSFTKPVQPRKTKWNFMSECEFSKKRKCCVEEQKIKATKKVRKTEDESSIVSQLEREMNAIHSDHPSSWPLNPFYGFESSDLSPPSYEPKSSFIRSNQWTLEMKTLFFQPLDSLETFSTDLIDDEDDQFSMKHALHLIIKPELSASYLDDTDLPASPSSLDSDGKGSSSPSSSKENFEDQLMNQKSKFTSSKFTNEKAVMTRTRRSGSVLKKMTS